MKYQLLKTSPLLSGQVRWDLIVERKNNKSTIRDLHIVPISDNVVFNEDNNRENLNYDHRENLKYLYRTLQSEFWSTKGVHNDIYAIYNRGHVVDPFDHTYEMGLRRMRYQRYQKQFSFLCPVWISENIDYNKLSFRVSVSDADSSKSSNNFRKINIQNDIYLSERVQKYLREFMQNSADGQCVDDNLVSFKFDPLGAYITGVNVDTGKYQTVETTNILKDLIDRERPLMEFDHMILSEFKHHNIIAQQLINFNIVFNIDDIVSNYLMNDMMFKDFNISVDVMYDGESIQKKDIYTNYTNIPAYSVVSDDYTNNSNVLDYLSDHKSRALAFTNKSVQPIFHWSLLENPEFIYNFYDGFAPVFDDHGETYRVSGLYYNQSNLALRKDSVLESTREWCRSFMLTYQNNSSAVLSYMSNDLGTIVPINDGITWFSNNKFDNTNKVHIEDIKNTKLDVMTIKVAKEDQIPDSNSIQLYNEDGIYLYVYEEFFTDKNRDSLAFLSNSNDMLTYGSISDAIHQNYENSNLSAYVKYLGDMHSNWIEPYRIDIFKSLSVRHPVINSIPQDVVDYYKDDNKYSYVFRYTGKLIPSFIDIDDPKRFNVCFFYKQWSVNSEIPNYSNNIKAGLIPEYPVIVKNKVLQPNGVVEKIDSISDNSFYPYYERRFLSKQQSWYKDIEYQGDITWLNDNRVWIFPDTINREVVWNIKTIKQDIINKHNDYNSDLLDTTINERMWDLLYSYISSINSIVDTYNINEEWFKQYIQSIYMISFDFDYNDNLDIDNIKYKIKYTLK